MNTISVILKIAMITALSLMFVNFGVKTPSMIISNYFEEVKKGDKNNNLLKAKSDVSVCGIEECHEEMSDEAKGLLLDWLKQIDYTINDENVCGEKAIVNVTVKGANITKGMINTIQESFRKMWRKTGNSGEVSDEEGKKIVDDIMIKNFRQLEIDERTADVRLVKNNNEWIVEDDEDLCNLVLGRSNSCYE